MQKKSMKKKHEKKKQGNAKKTKTTGRTTLPNELNELMNQAPCIHWSHGKPENKRETSLHCCSRSSMRVSPLQCWAGRERWP